MLRFEGGARGTLKASQIAAGEENGLKIRVHGELGGLEWSQMEPNTLTLRWLDQPTQQVRAGGPGLSAEAMERTRTPSGHPEGYVEAFANIYRSFAQAIRSGEPQTSWYPGLGDGLRTMAFVDAMVENSRSDVKWTAIPKI